MTTRKESLYEENAGESNDNAKQRKLRTIGTVLKILKEDGIASFWQGVIPALVLVANPIIQYTTFEQMKAVIEKRSKLGNIHFFLLGAISKLIATGSTYPY
ncbi:15344_t:CDS:1, partial [Acaulospora colombiana]